MQTQEEKYNGWTNWETWCVNLWLTNDQSVDSMTREILKAQYEYEFQRVDALKDFVYDLVHGNEDEGITKYITDDISLHRVNYDEIAKGYLEE